MERKSEKPLLLEKDNAQKELQNYVQEKLTGNYSSENSSKIQLLFQEGIENIQKAENSADISRALATTKAKLDEIKEEDKEVITNYVLDSIRRYRPGKLSGSMEPEEQV